MAPERIEKNEVLAASLTKLTAGDHFAFLYEDEADWTQVIITYFQLGIERGERCLFLLDFHTAAQVRRKFSFAGFPIEPLEESGNILLIAAQPFLSEEPASSSESHWTQLSVLARGYRGLRMVAEIPFLSGEPEVRSRMLAFEGLLHKACSASLTPCTVMYQYNIIGRNPDLINEVAMSHAFLLRNHRLFRNPYFQSSVGSAAQERPAASVSWWNNLEQKYAYQHRERFMAQVLENSSLPYSLVSPDGRIIDCNHAFLELTGYSWSELQSISWDRQLTPMVWWDQQRAALSELNRTGIPQVYEKEYIRKNGTSIPVELLVHRIQDMHGQLQYYYSFITDISLRKAAEQARDQMERRLSNIVDFLPDPMLVIDQHGVVQIWNKSLEEITGVPADQVVGRGDYEYALHFYGVRRPLMIDLILHPELRDTAEYSQLVSTGDILIAENYCPKLKGGQGAYLWGKASALYNEHGEIIGAIESLTDITERKLSEEAVRLSEEKHRTILENMEDGYFEVDVDGRLTFFNQSLARIMGYRPEEIINQLYSTFMDAENAAKLYAAFNQVSRTHGTMRVIDWQVIRKNSSIAYVESPVSPIRNAHDVLIGFRGLLRDITNRKQAEEALRESEVRYRLVFENSPLGIVNFSHDGDITACNESFSRIIGISRDLALRINLLQFGDYSMTQAVQNAISGKTGHYEGDHYSSLSGRTVPIEAQFAPILSETGHFIGGVAIFADVTERRRYEETIRHMAYHDALTGLPNRLMFRDRLAMTIDHANLNHQTIALMFLDLDNFKLINDTLGHSVGDRLLQEVADRMMGLIHAGDTVSRMGGDEFVFLFPGIASEKDATVIAQRILDSFKRPFRCDGHELVISASIGVSIYPTIAQEVSHLMKTADTALYHAKQQGRNNFQLFSPEMNIAFTERMIMENYLRLGLENGQFELYYQPLIHLQTGAISGVEALVRWNHPEQGLLLPGRFLVTAEETGLILPLERWVLHNACRQIRSWQDAGIKPLRVYVNLSGHHFWQQDLVSTVRSAIESNRLSADYLGIEITEGTAMQNPDGASRVLTQLRNLGIQIALDDFGTGYSSLSYLKKLPVDILKIDQSFIRDLADDPNNVAIFQAIMTLARNLRLEVTAEGVETEQQLEILRQMDCDRIQGFLYYRPMQADALAKLLREKEQSEGSKGTISRKKQ
ncbi:MAG: EAL domain-containing protein [Solirubrobacterales bacterium]